MRYYIIASILFLSMSACNWAKDKAKTTAHKAGEVVGKAGSEVVDGISQGVEESFANIVSLSPALEKNGIKIGRIIVTETDSATDNVVSVYLVFNQAFTGKVMAKALGADGAEFGRSSVELKKVAGDGGFVDFVFDKRTNIDRDDKIVIE